MKFGKAVEHRTCPQRGETCAPAGPVRHPSGLMDEDYQQCSKCGRWVLTEARENTAQKENR